MLQWGPEALGLPAWCPARASSPEDRCRLICTGDLLQKVIIVGCGECSPSVSSQGWRSTSLGTQKGREVKRHCVWMEAGPGIDMLRPGGSSKMLILGSITDLSVKGDGPVSHLSSDCEEGWGDVGEKVEAGRYPPHQKTDSACPTPCLILVWIS